MLDSAPAKSLGDTLSERRRSTARGTIQFKGEERNARGNVAFIVFILSQPESVNPYLRKTMTARRKYRPDAAEMIDAEDPSPVSIL